MSRCENPTEKQLRYWASLKGKTPKNIEGLSLGRDWAKGKKFSAEHREKLSEAKKGKPNWKKGIKTGIIPPNAYTEGARPWNKDTKGIMVAWNKGFKGYRAGSENHLWRGGVTPLHDLLRHCYEYKQWREAVFARDGYTCQNCDRKGYVVADHIKPFAIVIKENGVSSYEEAIACIELWDIENGKTLCNPCHLRTDTYGHNTRKKLDAITV